jgi:predicted alpha-1,6-mannanase (GH76 family)
MWDWTNTGAGGRHGRWRAVARATRMTVLVAVLAAIGVGYARSTAAGPAAPDPAATPVVPRGHAASGGFAAEAAVAAAQLQRRARHSYSATHLWQAASSLAATIDYMRATGSRAYLGDLSATYRAHHRGDGFHDVYYDDDGWWVLTWIKAYDLTGDRAYLRQAKTVFAAMAKGWTPACGGGVLWHARRPYKNAITNEEFLLDAVLLHQATPGDTRYARWALREWAWFSASGLLTGSHLVVDGLTGCRPKLGSPTWTYNQGTLIGALVSLAGMTGQRSLLVTAGQVAHAVMGSAVLSPHGILREPCPRRSCGRDGPMFKGIFMENLKLLYDRVGGAAYRGYMRRNAASVWANDRRGAAFDISWAGPFRAPTMTAEASALAVLTTQIPPRACPPATDRRCRPA